MRILVKPLGCESQSSISWKHSVPSGAAPGTRLAAPCRSASLFRCGGTQSTKNRVYECGAAKHTAIIMAPKFNPAAKDKVRPFVPPFAPSCLRDFPSASICGHLRSKFRPQEFASIREIPVRPIFSLFPCGSPLALLPPFRRLQNPCPSVVGIFFGSTFFASELRAPRSVSRQAFFHKSSFAKLRVKGTFVRVGARLGVCPLPTFGSTLEFHASFPTAVN